MAFPTAAPVSHPCHIQHTRQCWQGELHPILAPALLGGTENPPYLHCFPTSAWKTQPRTTSPKQHQSSGKQKEVKGKLFIAKPSSFVVKYCLILSLRHLLSHSPYYFSSYYCLIFPIQKVHTDTSQFPSWHNCLGETSSCFTGVLKKWMGKQCFSFLCPKETLEESHILAWSLCHQHCGEWRWA